MNMYLGADDATTAAKPASAKTTSWDNFTVGLSNLFTAVTPLTTTIIETATGKAEQERTLAAQKSLATMSPMVITIPGTNQQIPTWIPIAAIGGLVFVALKRKRKRRR